jgi:hypothetical protein
MRPNYWASNNGNSSLLAGTKKKKTGCVFIKKTVNSFHFSTFASGGQGALFEILKRTVICHLSFVIGEKNNIQKPPLIGRGCQPPAPQDPNKSF